MGIDKDFSRALYKAMVASNMDAPVGGKLIATIADQHKHEAVDIIREFTEVGYEVFATEGTALFLNQNGVKAKLVKKMGEKDGTTLLDLIINNEVDLLINTASKDKKIEQEAAVIRKTSVQKSIPCITSLDTAKALLFALRSKQRGEKPECMTIDSYMNI
ncbi:MAG: carbamoyl-phosphate synthase large chain, partial [Armatimonadota bacterium]